MKAKTVELHLLQSFPPSCVNRDGNNSPKDCNFGETRRARISSQCLKRAIREASVFEENAGKPAARSRLWVDELARDPRLTEKDDRAILAALMTGLIGEIEDSSDQTDEEENSQEEEVDSSLRSKVLLHLPRTAGDAIIPIVTANRDSLRSFIAAQSKIDAAKSERGKKMPKNPHHKELAKLVKDLTAQLGQLPPAPDIALYGRMLAKNLGLNVDAAAQVAHAISTHKLSQEMDYWTAVDDFQPKAEPGAGMLGTAEFNASVFYRYVCLNIDQLARNLGEKSEKGTWLDGSVQTRNTVQAFLLASYDAIPTGKLNGHAHFNPPFFALAAVRTKGIPLNLCNAFLDPVRARNGEDTGAASADALLAHLKRMRAMVPVDEARYVLAHALPEALAVDQVKLVSGYAALVDDVMEALK